MLVKINPEKNFFGEVFGADSLLRHFPELESIGIVISDEPDAAGAYMILDKYGKPVHDTAFFTEEELEHLIIIK